MNEHKTASFVAKDAWLAFLVMLVVVGLGLASPIEARWPWFVLLTVAFIASGICGPERPKK